MGEPVRWCLVSCLLLVLTAGGSPLHAGPGPFIPAEDPVYGLVDELRAQDLLPVAVTGQRPWTARQVLGWLDLARTRLGREGSSWPAHLAPRVERARRRLLHLTASSALLSPDALTLRLARRDGLQAWDDFGRDTGDGLHVTSTLFLHGELGRRLSLSLAPEWTHAPEGPALLDGDRLDLHEATLSMPLGTSRVVLGRQPLFWGYGRTGSLLMGHYARPLDQIRFESDEPFHLGLGRILGDHLVRYQFFLANLGEGASVPRAMVAGLRFDLRASPHLELSLQRTVMYGGHRDPDPDYDFWDMLFGRNENPDTPGEINPSNNLAGFGLRYQGSALGRPLSLHAETYGEDLSHGLPTQKSWLWGADLPRIDPRGRLGLRFEELNLAWHAYVAGAYRYYYHGLVLGHPAERDARLRWVTGTWHLSGSLDLALSLGRESVDEDERYLALEARWLGNGRTGGRLFLFDRDRAGTTDVGASITRRW